MILDHLQQAALYEALHPGFRTAFAFLRRADLATCPTGRYELEGDRIYANVDEPKCRGREAALLECHRKYIDVQYMIRGDEQIGWRPLSLCTQMHTPFNAEKDYMLYSDASLDWNILPPQHFMIFFPQDAHAPLVGTGAVRKVVVKVAV